jgi:hypothetical protein
MAVGQVAHLGFGELDVLTHGVDHHEIVAEAVHLGKREFFAHTTRSM